MSAGAIAGIMGNMQQENSFSTADNAGGMGIVQWTQGRRTAEINYAKQHGLSPTSLEAQLGYLWQELTTGSGGIKPSELNGLTASAAAQLFEQKFERAGKPMMSNRINYANQIYSQFGRNTTGR